MCWLIGIEFMKEIVLMWGLVNKGFICFLLLWIILRMLVGVFVLRNNLVKWLGVKGFCFDGFKIKVLL